MTDIDIKKTESQPEINVWKTSTLHPLRGGMFVCFATAGSCLGAVHFLVARGESPLTICFLSMLFSLSVGLLVSAILLYAPYDRLIQDFNLYIQCLAAFRFSEREISLDSLRRNRTDILGKLSYQIYEMMTGAYVYFAEASRLKRSMDDIIKSEVQKATSHLDKLAHTDSLTNLNNRRALDIILGDLADNENFHGASLLCLILDIDHFKNINDVLGHDQGDRVLKFVAGALQTVLRDTDQAFRMSGDQFIVLFPGLDKEHISSITKRLRKRFQQMAWPEAIERCCPKPTLSMGIAIMQPGMDNQHGTVLLNQAKDALHRAKIAGMGNTYIHDCAA